MKSSLSRIAMVCFLVAGMVSTAQAASAVKLPVSGTFAGGGQFSGNLVINRFEQRGNDIVAIGFVSGVLSRGSKTLGTGLAGEVTWPVSLSTGGTMHAASATIRPQATPCSVLSISLGAQDINLLGFDVAVGATTLNLSGQAGPLGDLVCSIEDLLGNVAGVVNLLNSLLGLLTGLLGGLTGA